MLEIALRILFTDPFYETRNFFVAAKLFECEIDFRQSPLIEDSVDFTMTHAVNFKFVAATVHFWHEMVLVE